MQRDTDVIHREAKAETKSNCHLKEKQLEFSETRPLKDLVKKQSKRIQDWRAALHVK